MIAPDEVIALIREALPGAEVEVLDRTGMSDHFAINVVAGQFEGISLMDRHRMVMGALQPAMQDGRLHAAEIKTALP